MGTDVRKVCEICNEPFITKSYIVNAGGGTYCSQKCSYKSRIRCNKCGALKSKTKRHRCIKRAPLSEETKRKIGKSNSIALLGIPSWNKGKRGYSTSLKGRKLSAEHRKKISNAQMGRKAWCEGRANYKIRGKNHYNWKGGISSYRKTELNRFEYRQWRKAVFERDNYTCQECDKQGERLSAHHIKTFTKYPKLRYVVSNGITLCAKPCHSKTIGKEIQFENYFTKKLQSAIF